MHTIDELMHQVEEAICDEGYRWVHPLTKYADLTAALRAKLEAHDDMLAALKASALLLRMFYDPSEDKANNPQMRATGNALDAADAALAKAEARQ